MRELTISDSSLRKIAQMLTDQEDGSNVVKLDDYRKTEEPGSIEEENQDVSATLEQIGNYMNNTTFTSFDQLREALDVLISYQDYIPGVGAGSFDRAVTELQRAKLLAERANTAEQKSAVKSYLDQFYSSVMQFTGVEKSGLNVDIDSMVFGLNKPWM